MLRTNEEVDKDLDKLCKELDTLKDTIANIVDTQLVILESLEFLDETVENMQR